jgi:transposase-like protein/IS1 family transposase
MSNALACPHCGSDKHQVKNGTAPGGVPRFKCQHCQRTYSLVKKTAGYPPEVRLRAVQMYLDGTNFRRVGRFLGVNHQSVVNWVKEYHDKAREKVEGFPHANVASSALDTQPNDDRTNSASLDVVEGDEIFTFIGDKKNEAYIMTWVERSTRCIVAHRVVMNRTEDALRKMVWQVMPSARRYFNDAFSLYDAIGYPGGHHSLPDKRETYSAEGDNAELRHYLARLARRSRCFSRRLEALERAVDLFVMAWNRRQRFHRKYPKLRQHLIDFVTTI